MLVTTEVIFFVCLTLFPILQVNHLCERRPVNSDLYKDFDSHSTAHLPSLLQSLLIRAAALAVD